MWARELRGSFGLGRKQWSWRVVLLDYEIIVAMHCSVQEIAAQQGNCAVRHNRRIFEFRYGASVGSRTSPSAAHMKATASKGDRIASGQASASAVVDPKLVVSW